MLRKKSGFVRLLGAVLVVALFPFSVWAQSFSTTSTPTLPAPPETAPQPPAVYVKPGSSSLAGEPQRRVYYNTSLVACPQGERRDYFWGDWAGVGDHVELRSQSWCGAVDLGMVWSNNYDPLQWRKPYRVESCHAGGSWNYSHAQQNGSRYISPYYRGINLVCLVTPLKINLEGASETKARPVGKALSQAAVVTRNGVPEPGVAVSITAGALSLSATTDSAGRVAFAYIPPWLVEATEQLTASCSECEEVARKTIKVHPCEICE